MDDFTAPEVPGFRVGRVLGRGGSSTVWLVTEEGSGRDFALKCLGVKHGRRAGDAWPTGAAAAEDLHREIRILAALDHQHLIKAHDAVRFMSGQGAAGPGGTAVSGIGLLLDYAPGGSLAELVGGRCRLPVGEMVTVLTPIAQALGYLHANGFTHGDVSPGNVLFTGHGKPMLSDVGIAGMVGDAAPVPDHGTAGFMDPAPVDAVRAGLQPERDVYSAAALGWYCLTGDPPRRTADRPPLSLLVPDVPPELAAALEAGLNEDRRLRPTAVELATAIYRSAPALPIDLASSVHATVIPQLVTRRRVTERPDGAARIWLRAWGRRIATSRWSKLVGARQRLPFPATEAEPGPGRPAAGPAAGPARPAAGPAPQPAARGKHAAGPGTVRPREGRAPDGPDAYLSGPGRRRPVPANAATTRGTLLLAAGAAAVAAGAIWAAGTFGPAGPAPLAADPEVTDRKPTGTAPSDTAPMDRAPSDKALMDTAPTDSSGNNPAGHADGAAAPGRAGAGIPADVAAQLSSPDPSVAVHALAAVRSLAFSTGRLDFLDLVNAPGSSAAAADARIRDQLQGSGHLLAGFSGTVSHVQVQAGSSAERAVVAVMSAASSYVEQDRSGVVVAAGAPGAEQALHLVLVTLDGQWRITDILPGS